MPQINLLPNEISPKSLEAKLTRALRLINTIALVLIVLSSLLLTGYFIFAKTSLASLTNTQNQLKNSILNLESSEQRLVVLKDRLNKIKTVNSLPSSKEEVSDVAQVLGVASGIRINQIETSVTGSELTVGASDSSSMSAFVDGLVGLNIFSNIKISSFSFNPSSGYAATFVLTNK